MKRSAISAAVAALVFIACASSASAASTGTLGITDNGNGTVTVSGSATYDCAGQSFCGWFPVIYQVAASVPCNQANLWYVGQNTQQPTQAVSNTGTPYFSNKDANGAFRMCLGIESLSTIEIVAEAVYTPAPTVPPPVLPPPPPAFVPPPATPRPPPSSTFTPIETMSLSDARLGVRTALYRRLGSKFVARRDYHISCGRLSRIRFSCRAKWHHGGQWRANVEVFGTASDGEQFIDWKVRSIKRPTERPTSSSAPPPPPPPPASSCNPAYPTVCIPDVPFDLDCPDVSARNFSVPGSDPDGFDGDGDGIGCES